jgi:ubiquinone/menaquinone biosynthesis C-methylase UbiE
MKKPRNYTSREKHNKTYHQAQDKMSLLPNYYRWMYSLVRDGLKGTVVELGAGAGYMIRFYQKEVDQVIAVDYNAKLLHSLRCKYNSNRVEPVSVDLKEDWTNLKNACCDTVVALDVLEHFDDDKEFLLKVKKILKPEGQVIIKVPAQSALFSEVDVASGHFRRYDVNELKNLLEGLGFCVVRQQYMNSLGAFIYKFKKSNKNNFSRTFSPWILKAANVLMPVIALIDKLIPLKGLSIIGIYKLQK